MSVPTVTLEEAQTLAEARGLPILNEEEARQFAKDPRWPDEDSD